MKQGQNLILAFFIFRLKADKEAGWGRPQGLGIKNQEQQTIVFIALETLDVTNGFFMSLTQGGDVCLDSKADVQFPPTGGGLGMCIVLDL